MVNDDPPALEDMTHVLKKMHLDVGQQSTGSNSTKSYGKSTISIENIQNTQRGNIRRTEDKTSLVSIDPDKHVLITNERLKQETPILPKSQIKPFKKGFLNATPRKNNPKVKPHEVKKEDIPFIKPTKSKEHDNIPDFMRVQDPERIALQKEVKEMLQPTQELVKDVMETTVIRNGLEDHEIMEAVSEIAGNPDAMHKYKSNKKVTSFYNQLGILMKDRMDKQDNFSNSKNRECKPNSKQQ